MREMISQSVNDALAKRKEERDKKKNNSHGKSNELTDVIQDQRLKFYEQQFNQLDVKFKETEQEKLALQALLAEKEAKLREKAEAEEQLEQRLQEEEKKRKEEEKLRKEKE